MGQKANLLTLRKAQNYLSLYRFNYTEFLYGFSFLAFFKKLFTARKVFITDLILNVVENKIYLAADLFFRVMNILIFKKLKLTKQFFNNKTISLLFKSLKFLKKNLLVFRFVNINLKLKDKKKLLLEFFRFFKRDASIIFPRRFNFFLDFLKLSILFQDAKIKSTFFITILAEMFRILQKKKHTKFLFFIKKYFNTLLTENFFRTISNSTTIKGIKLIINGKLKGKPRSSRHALICGQIPIQSLDKNIEYAQAHAFTIYGTFGLKLWLYRL